MPDELHQGIKHAAKERGTSEAELIRTAVRHELLGAPADQQERAQRRTRLLAAMGKLDKSPTPPATSMSFAPVARLIVLDASVTIAAPSADEAHHDGAVEAFAGAGGDELVLAATTRAEVQAGPARVGGEALAAARDFVDGCETTPASAAVADAAAALKAQHRGLSSPARSRWCRRDHRRRRGVDVRSALARRSAARRDSLIGGPETCRQD